MTVSIIIAAKGYSENLKECVNRCLELEFPDFEVLILPDSDIGTVPAKAITDNTKGTVPIKIIPTGPVSPPKKRDIALNHARGEILAFIDDDAYPAKDWLKNAIDNFKDENISAVGGPAITPESDSLRQKASGVIYSSFLVSGKYVYRYLPKKRSEVDDYPSCNFLVRKSIMQQLGGFKTNLWPGEDTKLCLDITKRLDKKIIYDPEVLVYHHRRPLFIPHLKQVANYALHRGYFVKKFPQTSLRITYFLPSIFVAGLILGPIIGLFIYPIKVLYISCIALYLILVFISSLSGTVPVYPERSRGAEGYPRRLTRGLSLMSMVFSGIILTHITYGIFFIKGLLVRKLKEE
jgi:glycosyltransferase involved in cell wall biosynthesis